MFGIKLTKTDNCIIFKVINRFTGAKSSNFYVSKTELSNLNQNYNSFFDGDNTLRIYQYHNSSLLSFRFFSDSKKHDLYINMKSLKVFMNNDKESTTIPANVINDVFSKINLSSRKNLKEILQNKVLKKKFSKAIMRLRNSTHDKIDVIDDHMDYSFYFIKYYEGSFDYNGGLIFHKDYHNRENLGKGNYSIHT